MRKERGGEGDERKGKGWERREGEMRGKGKGKGKRSIAVRKKPHRYGNSRAIWDHTVLPATRQR